jgi:N-acetylglutamate synthase-like GNAT family acetyltransferase
MARALAAAIDADPEGRACVIGTDAPDVPPEAIEEAFAGLEASGDVVLGPAEDGGYWLVGARGRVPREIFDGMSWGTATVLEETLRRWPAARLVSRRRDVDDVGDLRALAAALAVAPPSVAPATRRLLATGATLGIGSEMGIGITDRDHGSEGRLMAIRLRPATARDLATVLALLRDAGLSASGVEAHFPAGYVVAYDGEEIIGAAGLERHGDEGLLRSVVVAEARRGEGVARMLVEDLMRLATRGRLTAVYLLTPVAAPSFTAAGFETIARETIPAAVLASSPLRDAAGVTCMRWRPALGGP